MRNHGFLESRFITTKEKNEFCIRWHVEQFFSTASKEPIRSREFFSAEKYLWYLTLEWIPNESKRDVTFYLRLVLDRKSECKEAIARFKLSIWDMNREHECNLDHSKTFKFDTKSENSAGMLFSTSLKQLDPTHLGHRLWMVCEMCTETTFLEDNSFSNDIGSLLKTQLHTDVVIKVGEKNYPAHKVILAARSPVFAAMFAHNMKEKEGVVRIDDIDEDVVENMLRYVYTGEVEGLENLAGDLFRAADKYDLKGLRIKCEETLSASLSSSNAFDLLLFAGSCNAKELKSKAIDFITIQSTQLMKTSAWENLKQSNPEFIAEIAEALLSSKFTMAKLE